MTLSIVRAKAEEKREGISCPADFFRGLSEQGRSPATLRSYQATFRLFEPWFADTFRGVAEPGRITESVLAAFVADCSARGLAPATIARHVAALRSYLVAAHRPIPKVSTPRQQPSGPRNLSELEVRRLVHAAELERRRGHRRPTDLRDEALIKLLVDTGLRLAEACGLRVEDLEMGPRHGWATVRGKGGKVRQVPLRPALRDVLAALIGERPSGPIFLSQKGGALTPLAGWGVVKRIGAAAGVELTPHMLRHTFAVRVLREHKADLPTVQALLGHSHLTTTQVYTQPNRQDLLRAVDPSWEP